MADIFSNGRRISGDGQLYVVPRPSSGIPNAVLRNEGWALDRFGYSFVEDAGLLVPDGAHFIDGVAHTLDGAMYVTDADPDSDAYYRQGFAIRADGAMHVNTGAVSGTKKKEGILLENGRMFVASDLYNGAQVAWYRFGVGITESGGAVSAWADQSGEGNDLEQATATNQPALQAEGSILFDGVDNYLQTGAFTLDQPFTVYLLMAQITWTDQDRFYDGLTAATQMTQANGSPNFTNGVANRSIALGSYGVVCSVHNNTDSVIQVNNGVASSGTTNANNAGGFTLGSTRIPGNYSNIQVKEVILFGAAHDAGTRERIINYLINVNGGSV